MRTSWGLQRLSTSSVITTSAPRRTQCLSLNRNPPEPKPSSCAASEAPVMRGVDNGKSDTILLGFNRKMSSITWNACNKASVKWAVVSRYCLSLMAASPALAILPNAAWSKKVTHLYSFAAVPARNVPSLRAVAMMSRIFSCSRGRIHKRTTPCVRMSSKSWTKPRKSPWELGFCRLLSAKG